MNGCTESLSNHLRHGWGSGLVREAWRAVRRCSCAAGFRCWHGVLHVRPLLTTRLPSAEVSRTQEVSPVSCWTDRQGPVVFLLPWASPWLWGPLGLQRTVRGAWASDPEGSK